MNYYLSSLSLIIIGVGIFLSITSHGYQYYPAQVEGEGEGEGGEEKSGINTEEEEESSDDIFSDLSRNLPNIEENIPNNNEEHMDSEKSIFENHDTKDLEDNNEISNSENIVESNDQGATSESIEKSFGNRFSDSGQVPDIINEDDSSSNTVSNPDANDKNIVNPSD
jgi:hypothetical protein